MTAAIKTAGKYSIRLRSKQWLDLEFPNPAVINIPDIAEALGKLCRFGGRCNRYYSVAEHLCLCDDIAKGDNRDIEFRRTCFMHDAHEAYIGDWPSPLKALMNEQAKAVLAALESNIDHAIVKRFDLKNNFKSQAIKEIDYSVMMAEKRELFDDDGVLWYGELDRPHRVINVKLENWPAYVAGEYFAERAAELGLA